MKISLQHKLKLLYGRAFTATYEGQKCIAYEIVPNEALNEDLEVEVDIQSPHLRQYLELLPSKNGEKDYFIFQYVEGMTLQSLVQKKQILSEQQLLQIVKSVLAGLKDLHRSGTLGRCISINSIMLTPSNQAVLMEFGFAPQWAEVTQPPEIASKQPYGLPIDIWLVGLLSWQLMHMKVLEEYTELPMDQRLRQVYSKDLINVVQQMLEKDPSKRITFAELYQCKPFQDEESATFYEREIPLSEIQLRIQRISGGAKFLSETVHIPYHLLRHSQLKGSKMGNTVQPLDVSRKPADLPKPQKGIEEAKEPHNSKLHESYQIHSKQSVFLNQTVADGDQRYYQSNFMTPTKVNQPKSEIPHQTQRITTQEPLSNIYLDNEDSTKTLQSHRQQPQTPALYQPYNQTEELYPEKMSYPSSGIMSSGKNQPLQPPSLSQRSSLSGKFSDSKANLFKDTAISIDQMLDVQMQNEEQFAQIHLTVWMSMYRLGFLKRQIQELTMFVQNTELLDVSMYFLMKARLIYGWELIRSLKYNTFKFPIQSWQNYISNSLNYKMILSTLPQKLDQEKIDFQTLYSNAVKHVSNLRLNPQLATDVVNEITPVNLSSQGQGFEISNFDQIKVPYRKIMFIQLKYMLQTYEESKSIQHQRAALKVLFVHLVNRVFEAELISTNFADVQEKYGSVNPVTIESFIDQANGNELKQQMNRLMSTYFK